MIRLCLVLVVALSMPVELFSQVISGRAYFRESDGTYVISKNHSDPNAYTVISDRSNFYYKRVYAYPNDPLAKSVLNRMDTSIQNFGDFRSGNGLRDDYDSMVGKYEG